MPAPRPGRLRVVVECRSREWRGGSVWVARLECGAELVRPRRLARGRKDHPAPVRAWCACPRCR